MTALYLYLHANQWVVHASLFEITEKTCKCVGSSYNANTFYAAHQHIDLGLCSELIELQDQIKISLCNFASNTHSLPAERGISDFCAASFSLFFPVAVGIFEVGDCESPNIFEKIALSLDINIKVRAKSKDSLFDDKLTNLLVKEKPQLLFFCLNQCNPNYLSLITKEMKLALQLIYSDKKPTLLICGNQEYNSFIQPDLSLYTNIFWLPSIYSEKEENLLFSQAQQLCSHAIYQMAFSSMPALSKLRYIAQNRINLFALDYQNGLKLFCQREMLNNALAVNLDLIGAEGVLITSDKVTIASSFTLESSSIPMSKEELWDFSMRIIDQPSSDEAYHYLYNKTIMPWRMPITSTELALEWALSSFLLNKLRLKILQTINTSLLSTLPISNMLFENPDFMALKGIEALIIHPNNIISQLSPEQRLLCWLDGLQPIGFCILFEDNHSLLASAGALTAENRELAPKLLEDNHLIRLGTVISPLSEAAEGTPILRLKIIKPNKEAMIVEIKKGEIFHFAIPNNEHIDVFLKPLQSTDVGFGKNKGGKILHLPAGKLGLIIDARGRPLPRIQKPVLRLEKYKTWFNNLNKPPIL